MGNSFVEEGKKMSDIEIISKVLSGRYEALQILIDRYMPKVISTAKSCGVSGVDTEELVAEGILAIFSAVKSYNPDMSSFSSFVSVCIKRAMLSNIRSISAKKRIPEDLITPIDGVEIETAETPEEIYINKESYDFLKKNVLSGLSRLECRVLSLYLEGNTYSEISDKLGVPIKSVDNALARIRAKIRNGGR